MKKEICKGGYANHYEVSKKPFIKWKYVDYLPSDIVLGFVDDIPVAAINKVGCLSTLVYDSDGKIDTVMGRTTLYPARVKFKDKLQAMKKAYLHLPSFHYSPEDKKRFKTFDKYYQKID